MPDLFSRLRITGTLRLGPADAEQLRRYIAEGQRSGLTWVAAEAAAYEQLAQDQLGHAGLAVEEVEPL